MMRDWSLWFGFVFESFIDLNSSVSLFYVLDVLGMKDLAYDSFFPLGMSIMLLLNLI